MNISWDFRLLTHTQKKNDSLENLCFSTNKTNRTHGNLTTKLKKRFLSGVFGVRRRRDTDRIEEKRNRTMSIHLSTTRPE